MLEPRGKKQLRTRLRQIAGQIDGIEKLIESDREIREVVRQLKATEKAIQAVLYDALDSQLRLQVAERLSKRLAVCPGDCSDAERLQWMRREFPQLDLKSIVSSLEWLNQDDSNSKPSGAKTS